MKLERNICSDTKDKVTQEETEYTTYNTCKCILSEVVFSSRKYILETKLLHLPKTHYALKD